MAEMATEMTLNNILDESEIESLPKTIKDKLERYLKLHEGNVDELKTQYEKLRIDSEQRYFELEKELIECQSKLASSTSKIEEIQSKASEMEKLYDESKTSLQEVQKAHANCISNQNELKKSLEQLEIEKRELSELLTKRDSEIVHLTEELKSLSEQVTSMSNAKYEALIKVEELASQEVTLQYREQRLDQERELINQQVEWLNKELTEKTRELTTLRHDRSTRILELQTQLDEKTDELKLVREMNESNKKVIEEQSEKIESLIKKIKDARDSQTELEEHFQQQLRAQTKLTDLYKSSSEDFESRIGELNTAIEELQKVLKQTDEDYANEKQGLLTAKEELTQNNQKLQLRISTLEKELESANDLLSSSKLRGLTFETLQTLSPSAAAASSLLQSGKTITEIYTEYISMGEQLHVEKQENQRLNLYLEQILQEIEERAPQLKRQREDYEKALETISRLTQQLEGAMVEHAEMRVETDDAKRKAGHLVRENKSLQQLTSDLGLQVQTLIKEVEELRGNFVHAPMEDNTVSSTELNSSEVITKKLVTFKNIEELQEQNQHLLAVVRDLSERQEKADQELISSKTADLKSSLELAMSELEELRAARAHQAEILESLTRQKDMYRVLLSHSEGALPITSTPLGPLLKSPRNVKEEASLIETKAALTQLQVELETYKKENAENSRLHNEAIEKIRDELSQSRLQNAKLSSQLEVSVERNKILQSNADSYRREINAITDKNQKLSVNAQKLEQAMETMRLDLAASQERTALAEVNCENLKAERDLLKSVEARLVQEKETLHREQKGQGLLLANLQALQNNFERSESETKIRLQKQVENLEREINSLRRKLDNEHERYRNAVTAWEKEAQQLRKRIDDEVQKQNKTRDELVDAYANLHSTKQELNELTAKLAAAESRLGKLGQPTTTQSDAAKKFATKDNKEGEMKDLKLQLTDSRNEMKALKEQLNLTKQHLQQFKTIANNAELQLKEENEANQVFKQTMEKRLAENLEVHQQLEQQMQKLEREKQEMRQEIQHSNQDWHVKNTELRKELATVRMELQNSLQRTEEAIRTEEEARRDCQAQAKIAQEAQDKYERELILHASDVEALTAVKKQLEEQSSKCVAFQEAAKKAEQARESSKASWQEQQNIMKAEMQALKDQCDQLQTHNNHLHDQMELMSSQITALQSKESQQLSNTSFSEDSVKSNEQLLEVIRFLRRDKEILAQKTEILASENQRLKVKVDFYAKQCEELQKQLNEELQKSQVLSTTSSQHAELIRKVEMLNVLADSNKLLREEKEHLQHQFKEVSAKVQQFEKEIEPLQEKNRELLSQNNTLMTDNQVLKNEVRRWQARTNQLVEQNSRANPEELRRAVQEKENLQKQLIVVTEESQRHRAEISRLNSVLMSVQNELASLKSNSQKNEKELQRSKEEHVAKDAQLAEQARTVQQVKKIGRKYKSQYDELKVQYDEIVAKTNQNADSAAALAATTALEQSKVELENKLQEANNTLKEATERAQKLSEEVTELKKLEESMKAQAAEKEERAKKILHSARQKITQLTNQKDNLAKENDDLKKKMLTTEQANEEGSLRLSSLKSQFVAKIARIEKELKESEESKQSIMQDKEQLQAEIEEMIAKLNAQQKQLELLQKQLNQQQSTKIASTATPILVPSVNTEPPPTANIKPLATPSPSTSQRLPHPHLVSPTPSGSVSRLPPTASIRPIVPQPRTATVLPTTATITTTADVHEEPFSSLPGSVSSQPVVPQATVAPTPAVLTVTAAVAPVTVVTESIANQAEDSDSPLAVASTSSVVVELESAKSTEELVTTVAPTLARTPTPTVVVSPHVETQVSEDVAQTSEVLLTSAENSQMLHKRQREEATSSADKDATEVKPPQQKRTRVSAPSTEAVQEASKPAIIIIATEQPAEQNQPLAEEEPELSVTEESFAKEEAVAPVIEDEVIVVESDDELPGEVPHTSEEGDNETFPQREEDEEEEEDTEEVGERMDGEYTVEPQFEHEEQMRDIEYQEETMDEEQFDEGDENITDTGADDDDVVEILDDDDEEDNQMDEGTEEVPSQIPPAVPDGAETASISQTGCSGHRPQFLPRIPIRTERLPSTGRQQPNTPFVTIGPGGAFEEGDDSIVPSTPTLFVPRRNDGFAEAVSSPHISQARFAFGPEMVVPGFQAGVSQLATQALGVDDTRMDLSQFDESSGRSVPTTPLQVSPPAEAINSEMSSELPSEAQPKSPPQLAVPEGNQPEDLPPAVTESTILVQEISEEVPSTEVVTVPIIEEPESSNAEEKETITINISSSPIGTVIEEVESEDSEVKPETSSSTEATVTETEEVPAEPEPPSTPPPKVSSETSSESAESSPLASLNFSTRRPTPIVWSDPGSNQRRAHSTGGRMRGRRMRVLGAQRVMRGGPHGMGRVMRRSRRGQF